MRIPTFYIDGAPYTIPCSMTRKVEKRESDNSGYMLDNHYNNDILASYATYTVELQFPLTALDEYTNLFDILAAPIPEYTFTMPYNQDYITFKGRVQVISDRLYRVLDSDYETVNVWRGTSFDIVGTEPIQEAE